MRRVFIYKRTHEGDPDQKGCFGIHDCMGKLRNLNYNAVIGVGGIGAEAKKNGIAGRVTWLGVGPRRRPAPDLHGDLVTFDQFIYLGSDGPDFRKEAPLLAKRMYSKYAPRFLFDNFNLQEQDELEKLLTLIDKMPTRHRNVVHAQTLAQSRRSVSGRLRLEHQNKPCAGRDDGFNLSLTAPPEKMQPTRGC